ncbi:MAG TPA: glutamate-cysteine ligase family protein [Candidatus Krumholzibacteria bacterium]
MSEPSPGLFEAVGVELEYMIVDAASLDVLPRSDHVIHSVAGDYVAEVERGDLAWSNELVLHVLEIKTNGPAPTLRGLDNLIVRDIIEIERILSGINARLMPGAAHPWMDPARETKIWPHEDNEIYRAFDRIFGCQGHGWSNLQCTHLNLPFAGDAEFARLHAAIRLVLPIVPALAASSPILDGRVTGLMDTRMHCYRENQKKIPSITGRVIPEPVYTRRDYEEKILGPMYADIAPFDRDEILRNEWLNARGAIARFDRNTIEIRIIDVQECPTADMAVAHAITCVLRALVGEKWQPLERQMRFGTDALDAILVATTHTAEGAMVRDRDYLEAFGIHAREATAGDVWRHLVESVVSADADFTGAWQGAMSVILDEGSLARRIVRTVSGEKPDLAARLGLDRELLHAVYRRLCDCLAQNRLFRIPS